MKVKELMEKLKQFDENLEIRLEFEAYQHDIIGFEFQNKNDGLASEEDTQVLVILNSFDR